MNLVGVHSVDCCVEAISCFGFIQTLYTFFSASTHRWSVLAKHLQADGTPTLKSLSDTRWSARADATKAVLYGYTEIKSALKAISRDAQQTGGTRNEADSLYQRMKQLETAFLCVLWQEILSRFNETSKSLQAVKVDIKLAIDLLLSLDSFINNLRDRFAEFEERAKEFSDNENYKTTLQRKRKRNTRFDSDVGNAHTEDVALAGADKFRTETFLVIIDRLTTTLKQRSIAYKMVYHRFAALLAAGTMQPEPALGNQLAREYPADLSEDLLYGELVQWSSFAMSRQCDSPLLQISLLHENELHSTFPNVSVALRMYLSLMITNCSGERSFSTMALIKNKNRATMGDSRLSALSLLSIESELLRQLNFSNIIETFASNKARKCQI